MHPSATRVLHAECNLNNTFLQLKQCILPHKSLLFDLNCLFLFKLLFDTECFRRGIT